LQPTQPVWTRRPR